MTVDAKDAEREPSSNHRLKTVAEHLQLEEPKTHYQTNPETIKVMMRPFMGISQLTPPKETTKVSIDS